MAALPKHLQDMTEAEAEAYFAARRAEVVRRRNGKAGKGDNATVRAQYPLTMTDANGITRRMRIKKETQTTTTLEVRPARRPRAVSVERGTTIGDVERVLETSFASTLASLDPAALIDLLPDNAWGTALNLIYGPGDAPRRPTAREREITALPGDPRESAPTSDHKAPAMPTRANLQGTAYTVARVMTRNGPRKALRDSKGRTVRYLDGPK